jgi:chaperone modulatory protein CbpM
MIMNKQEFLSSAGLQVQTLDLWLDSVAHSRADLRRRDFSDMDVARAHLSGT